MTREQAHLDITDYKTVDMETGEFVIDVVDAIDTIDKVYNYFREQTCGNCKYSSKSADDKLRVCTKDSMPVRNQLVTTSFGCNLFQPKD